MTKTDGFVPEIRNTGKKSRKKSIVAVTVVFLTAAMVCGVLFRMGLTGKRQDNDSLPFKKGDHVCFGRYPQTENGTVQPIEWRVLDVGDAYALIISEFILDCQPYNREYTQITWETCSLRHWLNGTFYGTAFNEQEQSVIALTTNPNPDNPAVGIDGGNDTEDRLFCLSIEELEAYFSSESETVRVENTEGKSIDIDVYTDRKGVPTAYARKSGAFWVENEKAGIWWLRGPDQYGCSGSYVLSDGKYDAGTKGISTVATLSRFGVHPALRISLSALSDVTLMTPCDAGQKTDYRLNESTVPGDHVLFGSFTQSADEPEPIEWRVLDVSDGKALMLSEQILDSRAYDDEGGATWETSSLRGWLNGEFYQTSFSAEEKNDIVLSLITNSDNPTYGTEGGSDTEDCVFCLSIDEVKQYFGDTRKLIDSNDYYTGSRAAPTLYACKNGAAISDIRLENGLLTGEWSLRTPGFGGRDNSVSFVRADGSVNESGYSTREHYGVRPAVWVSVSG